MPVSDRTSTRHDASPPHETRSVDVSCSTEETCTEETPSTDETRCTDQNRPPGQTEPLNTTLESADLDARLLGPERKDLSEEKGSAPSRLLADLEALDVLVATPGSGTPRGDIPQTVPVSRGARTAGVPAIDPEWTPGPPSTPSPPAHPPSAGSSGAGAAISSGRQGAREASSRARLPDLVQEQTDRNHPMDASAGPDVSSPGWRYVGGSTYRRAQGEARKRPSFFIRPDQHETISGLSMKAGLFGTTSSEVAIRLLDLLGVNEAGPWGKAAVEPPSEPRPTGKGDASAARRLPQDLQDDQDGDALWAPAQWDGLVAAAATRIQEAPSVRPSDEEAVRDALMREIARLVREALAAAGYGRERYGPGTGAAEHGDEDV